MGVRKTYRDLTNQERTRFVDALFQLKANGVIDQFAEIHRHHFDMNIHKSSHFLPWHREMLLRFERWLQRVPLDDGQVHPEITIPYWASAVRRSTTDPLWDNNFLGQFNSAWNLNRALGPKPNGILPSQQQVLTNRGRSKYNVFWEELERVIHNPPHVWVGGVMSWKASPRDPAFYLHHCWIDMLWVKWQIEHPGAPFVSSGPGAGLNAPLMQWPNRTPAMVLDHQALGYIYDFEL
jgi:tyrosinase